MKLINDEKLLRFIRVIPVMLIAIATFLIILVMFRDNLIESKNNLDSHRQDYLQQQKSRIQQEVNSVYRQLIYEKKQTEDALKVELKGRIYEAYRIAMAIYQENKDKSEAEITKQITTALRALTFNEGRGYYFIYKMDGVNVMLPPFPHMEGTSRLDMKDSRGAFITQDVINIAKNIGEGYHRWWFFKPGNRKQDHEKIGFVKQFAPLNWMIGTGEYVEDFEKDVQDKLLKRISEIRYGNSGYIFIIKNDGTVLAHQNKSLINKNIIHRKGNNKTFYVRDIINIAKEGGGFVQYHSSFRPNGVGNSEKISYSLWFDEWDWAIGTGFYVSESEAYLSVKEKVIREQNNAELIKLIVFSITLSVIMMFLAIFLSNKIASRFKSFQSRINRDFNELESARDTMQHLALYDTLTDLPNRIQFSRVVHSAIIKSEQAGTVTSVILVGLDNFKKINDLYGHVIGDKLLTTIARKFESILQAENSVSRFGGDEFIFCVQNLNNKYDAKNMVDKIQAMLFDVFIINDIHIKTSCSIGVASYPIDAKDTDTLIGHADISLYRAKNDKKGSVIFFDSSIIKKLEYDFTLEEELKGALERNEISVVYQPQICTQDEELYGVEALCRWNNRNLGSVAPLEFIDVAERIDLIHSIGQFVVEKACADIVSMFPNGDGAIKLSVNISPKQLKLAHFANDFYTSVKQSGIDIDRVTIEITENVLLEDQASVTPILEELRALGFGISLDDFGTGFSSLSYLHHLPISEIKIDRSFVEKILVNSQSDSLVKAILAIGQSCQMKVVAEGVETNEQYNKLAEYRCDLIQGYYFDKPLLLDELNLRTKQSWVTKK